MRNNHAHAVWANYGQDTKRPETQLPLPKSWEQKRRSGTKAGYSTCRLHSTAPRGVRVGKPPKAPLWPNPWTQPLLYPIYGTNLPSTLREPARETYLFLFPLDAIEAPGKSLPEFLVWPLIIY